MEITLYGEFMDLKEIDEQLRNKCKELGLNQAMLEALAGVGINALSRL